MTIINVNTGSGGGANLWSYRAKTSATSGDPGSGYLLWNNATQVLATQLNLSGLTDDNIAIDLFLGTVAVGDTIFVQDSDNSTNYQQWYVSSSVTVHPTYAEVPVTFINSGGAGTTGFANNHRVIVARFQATVTVPVGANPTATAGPTAVNGVATTFMRSDAAPAVQIGSSSQKGILQVDGTTITASAGVISAVAGGTGNWVPLVDGSDPPNFITDGSGNLIFVWYTP